MLTRGPVFLAERDRQFSCPFQQCWIARFGPHWLSRDEKSLDVGVSGVALSDARKESMEDRIIEKRRRQSVN